LRDDIYLAKKTGQARLYCLRATERNAMFYLRLLSGIFVAILASAGLTSAQLATPVPDSKPDFSAMTFLLGTWDCKTVKNSMGRGAGRTETDVNSLTLDGHYMRTDSTSKPFDTARTRPVLGQGWVSYDTAKKQWYSFGIGNFGGFLVSTSPGWKGNTIVWTDTYATDGATLGVTTTTKVSDTKITDVSVTKTAKGTETTSDVCLKRE